MTRVTVIDYGLGNLFSVQQALEHCGAHVEVTDSPERVLAAERLVLPGVGAFADGMAELRRRRLVQPIKEFVLKQRPFLGICLGMQMMFETSEEFGVTEGLGLMPGKVVAIPVCDSHGQARRIPHIGWSPLNLSAGGQSWSGSVLDTITADDAFYFVHSFMADPANEFDRLADCDYDGACVAAVVANGYLAGCQFHPEKSGPSGLKVIRAFLKPC